MAGKSKRKSDAFPLPKKWMPWIFLALSFLLYLNTVQHGFVLDDAIVITENKFTKQGIEGWSGILTKDTFFGFFQKEGKDQLVAGGRYRPFSLLFFSLIYEVAGDQPTVYHFFNLLFYGFLVVLLYLWLLRLFKKKKYRYWMASLATLIFAVHPVHTEVVANIKGMDEIFALLFSIVTALWVLRDLDQKNSKILSQLMAALFFFMGLMSKENTITFLAIIPLSVYLFRGRKWRPALLSISGPLLATLVFLGIRFSVLGSSFGEAPLELMNNPFLKWTGENYVRMGFLEKYPIILYSLGMYLWLFVFPHPLSHDYYPLEIPQTSFSDPFVLLSLFLYALLATAIFYFWKSKPWISFGVLIFLSSLSIVSNIVFPVGTNMSERFLFMPSVGLSLLAGGALMQLRRRSALLLIFTGLITFFFSIKTISRNTVWKDNYTLFTTDVQNSDNSAKLQNAAAGALIDRSVRLDGAEKEASLRRAIDHLKRARELHPTYKSPNLLLGNAYFYLGQHEKAVEYFNKALQQDPNFADAKLNLALSQRELNKFDKCISLLKSLTDEPRVSSKAKAQLLISYEEAGKAMGKQGRLQEAFEYFKTGLDNGGDPAKFNYFLGITSAQLRNLEKAKEFLQEAKKHPIDKDNQQNVDNALNRVISDLKNGEVNE